MKLIFKLLVVFSFWVCSLQAQTMQPFTVEKWPESDTTKYYTLKVYRHGFNFSPKVKYAKSEVEYTPSSTLTFDAYHTADVIYHWMRTWAEQYPNLVEI